MRRFTFLGLLLLLATGSADLRGAPADQTNEFREVYELLRTHMTGVSEAELDRAAVRGMLAALAPRVALVTNTASGAESSETPLLSKVTVFEEGILYLRLSRIGAGLEKDINGAYQRSDETNKLKGIVLDLRYTGGTEYAAAAATADLFASKSQPLLNWGSGVMSAHEKTNAIQVPLAILVNSRTAAAAEALAAVLRDLGAGLILGSRTAGQAAIMESFRLRNGGELKIATSSVSLGNGSRISMDGIKPDIDVTVNPDDERAYYADAFYVVRKTNMVAAASGSLTNLAGGTNGPRRIRFNEAELVREHREGLDRDTGQTPRAREPEPERPVVSDPALARALDLLNGLAVVRQSRS